MRQILFHTTLIINLLFYSSFAQERTVGVFNNTAEAFEGYTLFSPAANNMVYLIDNCGQLVNSWECSAKPGNAIYLTPEGFLYRATQLQNLQIVAGGAGGLIEKYNWDGDLVWSYTYNSPIQRAHHDFQVLPNGNVLILAWEVKSEEQCLESGRDPELLAENVLWPEEIIEVTPVGTNSAEIVWEWNAWDHLVQDFDASKSNFGIVSEHPEKINLNYIRPGKDGADWHHANSIYYNIDLDQIMLSVLFFDEIWIIDHNTTTDQAAGVKGDLLFRWGNPITYNQGSIEDQKLFGQHNAHWIEPGLPDEGKVLIFNNGVNRPDGIYSSVVKLDLNYNETYPKDDSNRFLPTDFFWEYTSEPNTDFYSRFISGAHRLSNGNTLITDGAHGTFFEINANKEEVWRYVSPITIFGIAEQGNIVTNPTGDGTNSVFRATKYSKSYPAFAGKNMTPGDPIESNPDLTPCEILEQNPPIETENQILVFPNPTKKQITILNYKGPYSIFNAYGKNILNGNLMENGLIQLTSLASGMYFLSLENEPLKKIIKN
jgi:hypothetical protein